MVRYSEWITDAWKMFAAQWAKWIAVCVTIFVPGALMGFLMMVFFVTFMKGFFIGIGGPRVFDNPEFTKNAGLAGMLFKMNIPYTMPVMAFLFIAVTILSLVFPPIFAGGFIAAFNQMRTGKLNVGDVWKGFNHFWPVTCYVGVIAALLMVGMMFCFIPAIYIGVCGFFGLPLVVEKRLGYWDAFKASREMVHRDFFGFLLFALLTSIISSLGSYLCYLPIVVSYPMMFLMRAVAYRDTFGVEGVASTPAQAARMPQLGSWPGGTPPQYPSPYPPPYAPPQQQAPPYAPPAQQPLPQYQPPYAAPPTQQPYAMPPAPPTAAPAPLAGQPQALFCAHCGFQLPADARFCSKCGNKTL